MKIFKSLHSLAEIYGCYRFFAVLGAEMIMGWAVIWSNLFLSTVFIVFVHNFLVFEITAYPQSWFY